MIKLQHTIVSIKGLRYVQLKSCLLKWPSHQKLASSRKVKQEISGISPSLEWIYFSSSQHHVLIHPLKIMTFPWICWQEKKPQRRKTLIS